MLSARVAARFAQRRMGAVRAQPESTLSRSPTAKEFKVVLDNGTLYVDQAVDEALGWTADKSTGTSLTLSGWAPHYFAITQSGTDSGKPCFFPWPVCRWSQSSVTPSPDLLARGTVESGQNPKVQQLLEYLKDR